MKLTDWYPKDVQPVRDGIYERDYGGADNLGYARFLNGRWYWRASSIEMAERECGKSWVVVPWRELAEKPKGSA